MSGFNYIIASISWSSARGSLTQYIYFVQVNHLEGLQSFFLQSHELKSDKDRIVIDIVHSLAIKIYHVTLMEAQHGSFFSVPALIMVYMTKYIDWGPNYTTIKQGKNTDVNMSILVNMQHTKKWLRRGQIIFFNSSNLFMPDWVVLSSIHVEYNQQCMIKEIKVMEVIERLTKCVLETIIVLVLWTKITCCWRISQ